MSRDIPTLLIKPNRRIVYFSIVTENKPEVVDNIFEIIDNFRIDVSEAIVTTDFRTNEKRISFFADFSQSTIEDINLFTEIIKKTHGVKAVQISDPLMTGVAIADIEFPITTFGGLARAVVFPESWFGGIVRGIVKTFGTTGLFFLYEAGKEVGLEEGQRLKKFAANIEKLVEGFLKILKSLGILNPISYELINERLVRIKFVDCIECKNSADLAGENPSCNLVRGIIDGLLESFTNKPFTSRETKCQFKGEEYCEIISESPG